MTSNRTLPSLSPEDIARQAHQLWQERGCPTGCDDEIWLEAERKMDEGSKGGTTTEGSKKSTDSENPVPPQAAPALTEKDASLDAVKKQEARAPQVPHHTAPTTKPAATGKPIWPRGHSS